MKNWKPKWEEDTSDYKSGLGEKGRVQVVDFRLEAQAERFVIFRAESLAEENKKSHPSAIKG